MLQSKTVDNQHCVDRGHGEKFVGVVFCMLLRNRRIILLMQRLGRISGSGSRRGFRRSTGWTFGVEPSWVDDADFGFDGSAWVRSTR
jgi:hypothetical protein